MGKARHRYCFSRKCGNNNRCNETVWTFFLIKWPI